MTTAFFERTGSVFEVTINGHAGLNPGGPDIVCAACSILAYTLVENILSIEDTGGLAEFDSNMDENEGYYHIRLVARPRVHNEIKVIMNTISTGFALLQHNYPAHVKLYVRSGEK